MEENHRNMAFTSRICLLDVSLMSWSTFPAIGGRVVLSRD
jgi:hypothetical protein